MNLEDYNPWGGAAYAWEAYSDEQREYLYKFFLEFILYKDNIENDDDLMKFNDFIWFESEDAINSDVELDENKRIVESGDDDYGDIFDERDKEIFKSIKNQEEEKTIYDLIQDLIGIPMTVGDLNTALKNIFSKHDEVFLLGNMLYDADIDKPQDLVIYDDTESSSDEYTITFNIIDIDEGTIEIIDVNVLNLD